MPTAAPSCASSSGYDGPCKGLIGPWSHHYGFDGLPGPSIGFLQEALRWWDHWLKGEATGVMEEPALRAWMQDSVRADRSRRTTARAAGSAESEWPPAGREPARLRLAPGVLGESGPAAAPRPSRSRARSSAGVDSGDWLGFGRPVDVPREQRAEDGRSLSLRHAAAGARRSRSSGSRARQLVVSADQPQALLAVRLCDVAPEARRRS